MTCSDDEADNFGNSPANRQDELGFEVSQNDKRIHQVVVSTSSVVPSSEEQRSRATRAHPDIPGHQ